MNIPFHRIKIKERSSLKKGPPITKRRKETKSDQPQAVKSIFVDDELLSPLAAAKIKIKYYVFFQLATINVFEFPDKTR